MISKFNLLSHFDAFQDINKKEFVPISYLPLNLKKGSLPIVTDVDDRYDREFGYLSENRYHRIRLPTQIQFGTIVITDTYVVLLSVYNLHDKTDQESVMKSMRISVYSYFKGFETLDIFFRFQISETNLWKA